MVGHFIFKVLMIIGVVWTLLSGATTAQTDSGDHAALIITFDYEEAVDASLVLKNTLSDGSLIERSLSDADVNTVLHLKNRDEEGLKAGLDQFAAFLDESHNTIVYYSGHAIQVDGENYLIGADGVSSYSLTELLTFLRQRSKSVIFILDACRNNPFSDPNPPTIERADVTTRQLSVRGLVRTELASSPSSQQLDVSQNVEAGLARVNGLRGTNVMVFFATEPGNVAIDSGANYQENGPFATALAKEITKPLELEELFRRVSRRVNRTTDGQQTPWRQGSLEERVYIAGKVAFPIP
ncbi:MAG: caspase family protein [Hyphomonas sp.]|nr:caspase family protein [Hyphomonas sp.]